MLVRLKRTRTEFLELRRSRIFSSISHLGAVIYNAINYVIKKHND